MNKSLHFGSVALVVAGLATTACAEPPTSSAEVTVRDSSGIRIVENTGAAERPPSWSVGAEPVFRVGWAASDPQFQRLVSGKLNEDGSALVADEGSNTLYSLSADGRLLRSLGGPGEGPGEFGSIGKIIELGGDSVMVSDGRNLRVTVFAGVEHVSDTRFDTYFAGAIYDPVVRADDGSFLLLPSAFAMERDPDPGWRQYPILRTDDFAVVDTVASLPLMYFAEDSNPLFPHGTVMSAGGEVAHAVTSRPEVLWYRPDGTLRQIARWDAAPVIATDAHWEAYEAGLRERTRNLERLEAVLGDRKRDFGGPLPFFRDGTGDRAGNIWLARYDISFLPSSSYDVVAHDGTWVGAVQFARDIRLIDITDSHVLGVELNELDVEAVVVYRLTKP